MTPAAVSQQMRGLEDAWKLTLFDRTTRTPRLTDTGLDLVGQAKDVIAAYDGLADKVSVGDTLSGEVILGAVPTTLTGLVPMALARLKAEHPDIRVRIVPGLTHDLLTQLDRGQIHGAIISRPDVLPDVLTFTQIAREEMILLVASTMDEGTPDDLLRRHPFIRFSRDAVVGRHPSSTQPRGSSPRGQSE